MSAMTRVAVVSAIALSSGVLLDHAPSGSRVEARGTSVSVRLSPDDATIAINNSNASRDPRLMTYTWPDRRVANAIVLKFDVSSLPAGAVVENATLRLVLIESDRKAEPVYTITAHKIAGRDPVIAAVTGYVADGVRRWTANSCCYNGAPMAQADISPPYDMRPVDKIRGAKTWNLTAMVREWLAEPSTNFGVLLNSDKSLKKDRFRFFASMEHSNAALRPYLDITYSLPSGDTTAPSVALSAPAAGAVLSGPARIEANATDNVGVAAVQFYVDGSPLGSEITSSPYAVDWDTEGAADGLHTLTAVARDAAGNTATAAAVGVRTANGILTLTPDDTSLNLDTTSYSTDAVLTTYTWPDNRVANAIVLKFDVSTLPAGATIEDATLHLALVDSDTAAEGTYTVTAHKLVGRNPVIAAATGYSADGVNGWTPNACCHNGAPLAQADISMAYDTRAIDKTQGHKTWSITSMVQDWVADPASNFGVLLNSDATALRDRYRYFASMEHPDAGLRPFLRIRYSRPPEDTTPPLISALAAANVTSTAALVVWTTNERADSQVEYGTSTAYGTVTPVDGALVTAHTALLSGLRDATKYYYRVRSRDAAGNVGVSADGSFTTLAAPDLTAPAVSLTGPLGGATITGTVAVTATASDNLGVAGVQFMLDGASLGAEVRTPPYAVTWDSRTAPDGSHVLTAIARDAAGNEGTAAPVTVRVTNTVVTISVPPQDTTLNTNASNYSADATLNAYTWPDEQVANAILMKFDVGAIPAGAVVQDATLQLALVESDTAADAMYTMTAHKIVGRNPSIAAATGYTADGTTPWTANACCHNNVPLAQADISPAYDARPVDKTPGFKAWTLTGMVQEWVADPTTNVGVLLNSDATKPRDRYRFFASAEHADAALRPILRITYTTVPDSTPPAIAGVAVSGITTSGATIRWSTNEPADSQVEYGTTIAYGSSTASRPHLLTAHTATVAGLAPGTTYHFRARSRDGAGNLGMSGSFAFTTPAGDTSAPSVAITSPAPDATVSGSVAVAASASDNVGVAGVQFKLDGANYGAEDTTAPYSLTWNTASAAEGTHTVTAVARDAAGNTAVSAPVRVMVSNTTQEGGVVFESNWDTATGGTSSAVTNGGRWPIYREYDPGSSGSLMSVVAGGPEGLNALRVQQRGTDAAEIAKTDFVPQSTDYYLRYYFKTDDTSSAGDHIVAVGPGIAVPPGDNLTFLRKYGGATDFAMVLSAYGCGNPYGYPLQHWGPGPRLKNGQWYRFEYHVDFIDATHMRVHPRIYDAAGALLYDDDDFRQENWGASRLWNGRNDWTLASFYAAGYSFCVNPVVMNDFGMGNNGQAGAADTGRYWYYAGVQVRTDRWPGRAGTAPPPDPDPSPAGIAANYPGDAGIENHPDVVFVEQFEESALPEMFSRWTDIHNGSAMAFSASVPVGSAGTKSLKIPWVGGVNDGGHLYKLLSPGVDDVLYVRYYIKYPASGYRHDGIWMGGYNPALSWPNPQAGVKPAGNDRFAASAEQSDDATRFDHYNYWMGMRVAGDGRYWGNTLLNNPAVTARAGEWTCVEQMVKLNSPVTASNGEHAIWMDGVKVSHLGQGFPNGYWSWGNFRQDPSGTPFEGFRWRSDANLTLNYIWLQNFAPDAPAGTTGSMEFDHVVVAKSYIGCLAP